MTSKEIREHARKKLKGNWGKFVLLTIAFNVILLALMFAVNKLEYFSSIINVCIAIVSLVFVNLFFINFTRSGELKIRSGFTNGKVYLKMFELFILLWIIATGIMIIVVPIISFSISLETNLTGFNIKDYKIIFLLAIIILVILSVVIEALVIMFYLPVTFIIAEGGKVFESIEKAPALMKGHKTQFLKLYISFILWKLASIVTLGIGLLWVYPYMYESYTIMYLDVIGKYDS